MKNINMIFATIFLFAGYAFAETHGGVVTANTQMEAVVKYAVNNGGDLYRALNIQKQNGSDLFTISYGGMDSNGNEKVSDKEVVKATVTDFDRADIKVKVEHVSGIDLSR